MSEKIKDSKELEFTIFCVENVAIKLGIPANKVYEALLASDILNGYIVPEYEMLHTQSKEYIIEDILEVMKERGIAFANPILLQKKYSRVVERFADKINITLDDALNFFYGSMVYQLMHEGISDMHCMSDEYLVEEMEEEYKAVNNK